MLRRAGKHIEKCEALCSAKNYPAGDLPGDARGLLTGLLGQTWDWQHLMGFKYFQEILPPDRARNRTGTDKGHSFTTHPRAPILTSHPDPTCSSLLYLPPTPARPSKISLAPEPTENSLFPQSLPRSLTQAFVTPALLNVGFAALRISTCMYTVSCPYAAAQSPL